jgi:hypothetical protein
VVCSWCKGRGGCRGCRRCRSTAHTRQGANLRATQAHFRAPTQEGLFATSFRLVFS